MDESTPYAHQDCWMFDNARLDLDIDVVLTAYKRPHVLAQQLDAIRNQTIAPKNIFLFQDGIDSYYEINLKRNILEQFDNVKVSRDNVGVWGRFEYLDWMLEKPYASRYKYTAEDMCLSFACQEHGVASYVPDHPLSDETLWGSNPQLGYKYGTSEVAVSINPNKVRQMNAAFNEMRHDGWRLVFEREPEYINAVSPLIGRRIVLEMIKGTTPRGVDVQLASSTKRLLSWMGKKYPVFISEVQYVDKLRALFDLRADDCIVINAAENPGLIMMDRVQRGVRKYALHIIFTVAYEQLKPYLEKLGLRENEDFIDGRGLLVLAE